MIPDFKLMLTDRQGPRPDLSTLNRLQRAVGKAITRNAQIEALYGSLDDGLKERQADLLALIVIRRAQAMAR